MDGLFDYDKLRVLQPGKMLADRAVYEIFSPQRELLATAAETEGHNRSKVMSKMMPDIRVLGVTRADDAPILTLTRHGRDQVTDLEDPMGNPVGRIRAPRTNRQYVLTDPSGETVAKVEGDLGMKHFSVTKPGGGEIARVRKTWAGFKEILTSADHYSVEFTGPVTPLVRTLTVMMPVVLDLGLYGPT